MKILKPIIACAMVAAICVSCGKKPKGDTVETSDAKEVAETTAPEYKVDANESFVSWVGYKPTGKHNGRFDIKSGALAIEEGSIAGGEIIIDMTAITVLDIPAEEEGNAKLKGHLSSDDFFNVAEFPTASFAITEVKAFDGELPEDKEEFESEYTPAAASENVVDSPTHTVTGNLTIKGTAKSISFPAKVVVEDGAYHAYANFNIDRSDWGIAYGDENSAVDKAKDKFIYNTVSVGFDIIARP